MALVSEIKPGIMDQHGRTGGGDGGGGSVEIRLTKLETRLDTILPILATRGDVSEAKAGIVMWLAAVIAASTAIIIAVLIFAINRVNPGTPQTPAAPVIVYPQAPASSPPSQPPPATSLPSSRR